jgi:hypothetical protein
MANNSIRIRTTPGSSKNVRIKLEQDFDFLEILSLKISQEDLYQTFCANYGVVVGRVIVNKGFGISNAKVSVFIPITEEDQKNQLIKDFYPFKTPYQKKDGIRYNLLVSKSTCSLNAPIGTFPTKEEVLDNDIILEVFEKYYKYTTKTNSSGDFMIFGVPIGQQTVHMDVDLSDTGAASLRPFDLIAEGFSPKLFKSNTEFKTSTNLDSLPQVKTANVGVDVIPFWGDPESCEVGITRVDFDTNADIKTTALFFGSVITDSGKMSLNKGCNPKNKQGRVENLKTGPGTIEMIRVGEIDPVEWYNNNKIKPLNLEKFELTDTELIDNDGTFAYAIPLNIGHIITDEFGNYVPSPDPSIGIATKGMYRFKMKMQGKTSIFTKIKSKFRTATMFFPSLGYDFGGTRGMSDTGNILDANGTQDQRWTTDITQYNYGTNVNPNSPVVSPTFVGLPAYAQSRIGLDFHLFEWKQIYTIAHYIKKYKKGNNRFSFLGLKQTDQSGFNPFPFTNAVWSFDPIYYIGAAIIDIRKFFIKLIIKLIGFCIKICMRLVIDINEQIYSGKTIAKITIPPLSLTFHLTLINFCYKICPLSFLGNIIDGFDLECENAPNGEGYQIPLVSPPYDGTWYACNPVGCGTSFGCNCTNDPCACPNPNDPATCDYNISNNNILKFGIKANGTNNSSPCLNVLTDWECCAKITLAESRDVIQRVFNDAWVFGTAYLFQFKYKRKIKRSTGELRKEKFCGPGSDHARGDGYGRNQCCNDTEAGSPDSIFNKSCNTNLLTLNPCSCLKCLVRGPGLSSTKTYDQWFTNTISNNPSAITIAAYTVNPAYGPAIANQMIQYANNANTSGIRAYHVGSHNSASLIGYNGAVDIEDLIYCNALMSTKIVSLGSQELCQETLEEITNASLASQALVEYEQDTNFYTGTFYENGWDPSLWINLMDETSYEDPIDVLLYMGKVFPDNACQLRDMFHGGGITGNPCHEYELEDDPYFFMKEISKIYIDIETAGVAPNEDEFSPTNGTTNPYADLVSDPPQWGGFLVDKEIASRFSPCGDYPSNCVGQPLNKWTNGINPINQTAIDTNEADNDGWDRYISQGNRNNPNSRSNIPYYYFGLNAGKTAINRLRTEFFTRGG